MFCSCIVDTCWTTCCRVPVALPPFCLLFQYPFFLLLQWEWIDLLVSEKIFAFFRVFYLPACFCLISLHLSFFHFFFNFSKSRKSLVSLLKKYIFGLFFFTCQPSSSFPFACICVLWAFTLHLDVTVVGLFTLNVFACVGVFYRAVGCVVLFVAPFSAGSFTSLEVFVPSPSPSFSPRLFFTWPQPSNEQWRFTVNVCSKMFDLCPTLISYSLMCIFHRRYLWLDLLSNDVQSANKIVVCVC